MICLLFLVALPALTLAQGVQPEQEEDRWSFVAGAYLHGVGFHF